MRTSVEWHEITNKQSLPKEHRDYLVTNEIGQVFAASFSPHSNEDVGQWINYYLAWASYPASPFKSSTQKE